MELKLRDKSHDEHKDCAIEVYLNENKLAYINFFMFCNPKLMLEKLPLIIAGNHFVQNKNGDQDLVIASEGNEVIISYSSNDNELEITLPKNLCIPIFKDMIKLYNS